MRHNMRQDMPVRSADLSPLRSHVPSTRAVEDDLADSWSDRRMLAGYASWVC